MGEPGLFPDTSWSLVSRLCATGQERYREGLDDLCRRYWRPAYAYVRAAWAKSPEEAKDLTQAFFLWLIEDEALRGYLPERGGFRPFLKTLLRRFVGHQAVALDRLKRGGGRTIVPLDGAAPPASREADPEKAFERAWLTEVVDESIRRVRDRRAEKGDVLSFRLYDAADLAPEGASYRDLAERHGLREGEVRDKLYAVREEIRAEVRRELARLTFDDRDLENEWRSFLGS